MLIQRDYELKRVHRIQTEAVRAEKGLIIGDFGGWNLKHQVLDHEILDSFPEVAGVVHRFVFFVPMCGGGSVSRGCGRGKLEIPNNRVFPKFLPQPRVRVREIRGAQVPA